MKGTKAVLLAFVIALFLRLFLFDFMVAQGQSMEPGIKSGAVLVVNKMRYGFRLPWLHGYLVRWGQPKTGDVVVFYTPSGDLAIKRCIGAAEGNFIAEGDNSSLSYDSRAYGPVPSDNIVGKVLGY